MTTILENTSEAPKNMYSGILAATFHQYLITSKSNREIQGTLTLFGNYYDSFSLDEESIPLIGFSEFFEEKMFWSDDAYSDILQAFGKAYIDITDLEITGHRRFQIPMRGDMTFGTLHTSEENAFNTTETTLFSLSGTWDLELEKVSV